jgi:hypothetical protein
VLKNVLDLFRIIYRFFADADRLTWASIGVTLVVAVLYFRLFFPQKDGFNDIPDDYTKGPDYEWLKLRVILFIMISGGLGVLAYHQLPGWFPSAFRR